MSEGDNPTLNSRPYGPVPSLGMSRLDRGVHGNGAKSVRTVVLRFKGTKHLLADIYKSFRRVDNSRHVV